MLEKYVPQFQFQENTLALSLLFCVRRLLWFYLCYISLTHKTPDQILIGLNEQKGWQWTCLNFTALNTVLLIYLLYQTNWTTNEDTSPTSMVETRGSRDYHKFSFGQKLKIVTFIIWRLAPASVCGPAIWNSSLSEQRHTFKPCFGQVTWSTVWVSRSQPLSPGDKNNRYKMCHERVSRKSDGSSNKICVQDVYLPLMCIILSPNHFYRYSAVRNLRSTQNSKTKVSRKKINLGNCLHSLK